MKVKELIEELKKYDEDLEVKVFKKPIRTKRVVTYPVKHVGKNTKLETGETVAVNIAY
ncbi:hypothetical protein [Clostridium butyricum]|uniref:hypothetical protein n=1 Tax=Clostridium butyricum TaxID=1492 RepID=UPI0003A18602|nr:hypothetical protein [Clostridium butyricum]MBZ5746939.1 hypothetical protein [Clostridium butyricum]MDI9208038.1 hypothetical protein [Clostridium butyricum]GEQ25856.1 hypothetical protein CBU03nite_22790 [Clostridium butyricum]